ncbi:MAG: SurA N-terminal domain-containing protein [Propionivibrio sp.]
MFDAVRNNKRIVQIFLGLITLPFAFWGVDSYVRNMGAGRDMASVGGSKISVPEFEMALRERQDQLRQTMGESFSPEMMNTPAVRLGILNSLIDKHLLILEADKKHLMTGDDTLRDVIRAIPGLQENGKFSMERYESALRSKGMSRPQFEARLRQDLTLQQLLGSVSETAIVSATQADALLRLQLEERQFNEYRIASEPFADKVKVDAAEVQKYYDDNKMQYEVAEQVKAEYVVLSLDALLSQVTVSDTEIKAWYDGHKDRYEVPEERRASHILILAKPDADKAKAKAKAEEVLAELQKSPAKFAELAKKYSEDPGSAQKGGDLGFFGRGMMVKPFEEEVFKQKEGDLSGLVESEFGYHIIKLTGIKAGSLRPIEEVKAEIEGELKRQAASRKFAEAAEGFNNMVYEQSDSLQPAADQFKLKIEKSDWIPKNADVKAAAQIGPLANPKILAALFTEDAVKNKRNTEAVEIAPNTLLAARVVEHSPASVKPFETVKSEIEALLKNQKRMAMAKAAGEEQLADLKKGDKDSVAWAAPKTITRQQVQSMPIPALQAIFKADAQKLPAYVGAEVGESYVIYKIVKVTQPDKLDEAKRKSIRDEYTMIVAQEDAAAYMSSLRQRYKIEINTGLLESRERQ